MKRRIIIALLSLMLITCLTACGKTYTCDDCGEEFTGKTYTISIMGEKETLCPDCYEDYKEFFEDDED